MNSRLNSRDRDPHHSHRPMDTAGLIARHGQDGRQISAHPACNATVARIRAASNRQGWGRS